MVACTPVASLLDYCRKPDGEERTYAYPRLDGYPATFTWKDGHTTVMATLQNSRLPSRIRIRFHDGEWTCDDVNLNVEWFKGNGITEYFAIFARIVELETGLKRMVRDALNRQEEISP
jgi:hypothetical protein